MVIGIGSIIQRTVTGISLTALVAGTDDLSGLIQNNNGVIHEGLGFNAPWMYGATHGPATTFNEFTQAAKYLNNPIIRFPGGTVSRTYHINLPGYDGQQPGETKNYIIPFTNAFSPNNNPVAKISFVVNIDDHFNHTSYKGNDEDAINDNLKTLAYLVDHGFSIPMVELGNEENLRPELFWSFGSKPWKPMETAQENIQALAEIKLKYGLATQQNIDYQRSHFKEGMDKYISLLSIYQSRINAYMDSKGLPHPKYGVSIPPVASMTYSDIAIWNKYYSERVRDAQGIDALIPHYYATIIPGKSANVATDLQKVITALKTFYGNNRRFWFTEFSAGGGNTDDSQEQINVFNQMVQVFEKSSNNTDYYFLHQFFKDGSDYGMLYKNISANSKPVNSTFVNGKLSLNSSYGLKLFYSPRFCWAVQMRGTSGTLYNEVKSKYGCR